MSAAPELILIKPLDISATWQIYAEPIGNDKKLSLGGTNGTDAASSSTRFDSTSPTSSVFTLRDVGLGTGQIAYCFHSVDGFSKIGSYTGTGAAGNFIETGFEPSFIMFKRTDSTGGWLIFDNKRNLTNPRNTRLEANNSQAEQAGSTSKFVDFYSNGFEPQVSDSEINASGGTYIYMAFAADPDTEAPTVAKSFSTVAYTGTGATNSIDGLGFSPNLVWIKQRSFVDNHYLLDSIRGPGFRIHSNLTAAQSGPDTNRFTSFDTDGFTVGSDNALNQSGQTFVAWAWKADDNEPTIFGGPALAVYKFEDNANDVTGNYSATTATNITYSSSGKFNKAGVFNGSSTKVEFDGIGSLPTGSGEVSWSMWVYTDTGSQSCGLGGYGRWNTGGTNSGAAQKYFGTGLASGNLYFYGYYYNAGLSPSVALPTSQWNHLVYVRKGSNINIYLNGSLAGTISRSSLDIGGGSGNLDLTIGKQAWSDSAEIFDGKIDQVRIYSGALDEYQVNELYNETASDNDDLTLGSPPEILISANANAGFSIVKFTNDNPGSTARVPHGLSSTPEMIIVKRIDGVEDWYVYHTSMGLSKFMRLNLTDAQGTATNLFNTVNSTVFNPSFTSSAGQECIAYCFHSVSGFSKFGSYSGGSTGSGNVITTGFQPDWIMIKRTDTADDWTIIDSVRGDSASSRRLIANTSEAEKTATSIWYPTSTGFYFESTGNSINASGGTYIYVAFKIN